ncbi:MAG: hypothetical protein IJ109_01975 [Firmicutes bacterium]|nr:hypothetical protein [Bacillota bacterium]
MTDSKQKLIFVTGYFGAPIAEVASDIASSKGWPVCDLDARIEETDGRSIARLCMMGGEHAYRNAEFEEVSRICEEAGGGLVVACGDGILYDDDSRGLILQHEVVITGEDQPLEELWERARRTEGTYHAFMKFGTEAEKRAKFEEHHARQKALFEQVRREQTSF